MKIYHKYLSFLSFLILAFITSVLSAERIRVATYNVKNYLITDRWYDGAYRTEYPKPEKEKSALRTVIIKVSPDILALQEMGDTEYLEELQRDLARDGLEYDYQILMKAKDGLRHTALLSKIPYENAILNDKLRFNYYGEKWPVLRGLMEVKFKSKGKEWVLFNVHLKSRRKMRDDDYNSSIFRKTEAQTIRDYIRRRYPLEKNPNYIVMGDFNDGAKSPALKRFYEVSGNKLMDEIYAFDSRGEQWTYNYKSNRSYEQVDYMLMSPAMNSVVHGSKAVIADYPESLIASDHRLVYVDLEF